MSGTVQMIRDMIQIGSQGVITKEGKAENSGENW